MKQFVFFFLLTYLMISCKPDEVTTPILPPVNSSGFYVINEGNFGWGNASLGFVDDSFKYFENVYEGVNSKKLGDVFQHMYSWSNMFYLVMNNSSKIEVIDKETKTSLFTIDDLGAPRYITVAGSQGFVNDLFSDKLTVFNLENGAKIKTISLGGKMDRVYRSWAWAIGIVNEKIYKIDSKSLQVADSFDFGMKIIDLVSDEDSMVFAIAQGEKDSLFGLQLNPVSLEIVGKEHFEFLLAKPNYLRANSKGVYFTEGQNFFRYVFDETSSSYSIDGMFNLGNIYGFEIHPITQDFYFCDAKDYTQKGEVIIVNEDLDELERIKVGVIPNGVIFENE